MQRTLTWTARVTAVLLLTCAWLAAAAGAAQAHASLVSSSPADGAMIAAAPDAIILRFDEPVDVRATAVRLFSGSGGTIRLGAAEAVGDPSATAAADVRVTLPALADDQYLVRWSATTSDDYHPVSGSFAFSVGVALQPGFASSLSSGPPWGTGIEALLRLVGLLGLAGAVGGAVLLVRLDPQLAERDGSGAQLELWTRRSAVMGCSGVAALGLVLLARAGSLPSWHVVLAWLAALVGLIVSAVSTARRSSMARPRRPRAVGWLGLVAAAWGIAALGHGGGRTAAGVPGSLVATTHVLATCAWLGGVVLVTSLVVPALRGGESTWARRALASFAGVAGPALALSVVTGLVLASVLVPSAGALTESGYGRVLLAKLVLVCLAAAVGAGTFFAVRSPGRRKRSRTSRRLLVEGWVLGGVVLLAAFLATVASPTGPRWAPGDGGPTGSLLSAKADDLLVTVRLSPGAPGPNVVQVGVVDTRRPSPGLIAEVDVAVGGSAAVSASSLGGPDWLVPAATIIGDGPQDVTVTVRRQGVADARATLAWEPSALSDGEGSGGRSLGGVFVGMAALLTVLAAGALVVVVVRRRGHQVPDAVPTEGEVALVTR